MPKTTDKNKNSPKKKGAGGIKMKINFSPVKKKSMWGNWIDVYQTNVDHICIAVATRMDKVIKMGFSNKS